MSPLCSECKSQAETTSTRSRSTCSRCGGTCDNCGSFTSSNSSKPADSPERTDALLELAFILGMAAMGFVWLVVMLL